MLPAHRTEDEGFSLPQFALTPCDVDGFLDELQAFHDQFRGCFARSEPREHFFHYMVGQCSALERKSIEPMARHVDGGNIRGMQRCMSDDKWDEDTMRETYHGLVADEMGDPQGVLMVDESGRWGRWKIVKWGCSPPMPRGRAMHWWTNDFLDPNSG